MTEWRAVTLGEISDQVDYGYTASAVDNPELPRFLRITDIVGSHINWSRVPSCVVDQRKFRKFALQTNDIVIARTGATVGHAKRIREHPESVFASYLVRFRLSPDVDPAFVGAVIESQAYKDYVLQHAGGAAQPNANANVLGRFPLQLPDQGAQKHVGLIFDALDDLIERNRRRIELLEQMAQAIYREWFVRFRYPGHEDDALVDSPFGTIPEGWEAKPLAAMVTLDRTTVQPHRSPAEMFDHYSIPAFDDRRLPALDAGDTIRSGKFLVTDPAVLVSKLNPRIERTWLVDPASGRRSVTSTEFLVLRPTPDFSLEYLYLLVRSSSFQERLQELSGGTSTSHQRAKPDDFLRIPVIAPPSSLVAQVPDLVRPQLKMTRILRLQNRELETMRDLMLPRLVTGQIDVLKVDLDALMDSVA
jgi:type I restriction enzyme S subunit